MIDLHCHLLPGLDDGAPDMPAALAMASDAAARGITHMVCTPHIHNGVFDNNLSIIQQSHQRFVAELQARQIAIHTHFAAEVRVSPDIIELHANNQLPYLGQWQGKNVLLLELPHSHIPVGVDKLLAWLLRHNVQPLLAHPERNREIIANYNKALWLKGKGVLFQLTAGVLTDTFSHGAKMTADKLLQDNLVDVVASDAHSLKRRPPAMDEAYQYISNHYSESLARTLCITNPWTIAAPWFSKK